MRAQVRQPHAHAWAHASLLRFADAAAAGPVLLLLLALAAPSCGSHLPGSSVPAADQPDAASSGRCSVDAIFIASRERGGGPREDPHPHPRTYVMKGSRVAREQNLFLDVLARRFSRLP